MTNTFTRVSESIDYPVSFVDIAEYTRVDEQIADNELQELIVSHIERFEQYTRRALITQQYELVMSELPDMFCLRFGPIQTIDSITLTDSDGNESVVDESVYQLIDRSMMGKVVLKDNQSWPDNYRKHEGIKVLYTCGFGDSPDDVPADIRHAIAMCVVNSYENRGENIAIDTPLLAQKVMNAYRCIIL